MTRLLRYAGLAALAALFPCHGALAAACTSNGTLTTYLAGGVNATCTVLDKTISDVTATVGFTGDIFVSPETDQALNPGLFFDVGQDATNITFTITAPSDSPMIGASLFVFGSGNRGVTIATETLSNGKSLPITGTGASSTSSVISFPETTSLTVTMVSEGFSDPLGILISNYTLRFQETSVSSAPEPASLTLMAMGLAGLGFCRRSRV